MKAISKWVLVLILGSFGFHATAAESCVRFHSRRPANETLGRGGVFPWAVGLQRIGCDVLGRWGIAGHKEVFELDSYDMDCRQVQVRLYQQDPSKVSRSALVLPPKAIGVVMLNGPRNEYTGVLRASSGPDVPVGFVKPQSPMEEYYLWLELPSTEGCRNLMIEVLRRLE
jgi:hypothetical protein